MTIATNEALLARGRGGRPGPPVALLPASSPLSVGGAHAETSTRVAVAGAGGPRAPFGRGPRRAQVAIVVTAGPGRGAGQPPPMGSLDLSPGRAAPRWRPPRPCSAPVVVDPRRAPRAGPGHGRARRRRRRPGAPPRRRPRRAGGGGPVRRRGGRRRRRGGAERRRARAAAGPPRSTCCTTSRWRSRPSFGRNPHEACAELLSLAPGAVIELDRARRRPGRPARQRPAHRGAARVVVIDEKLRHPDHRDRRPRATGP